MKKMNFPTSFINPPDTIISISCQRKKTAQDASPDELSLFSLLLFWLKKLKLLKYLI
jgi:hypothetical protein